MSATWRTSDLTILVAAGVTTVLLTAVSFFVSPTDSLPRDNGSSYATHPDGAGAAYLLLRDLGYTVERSFEPLAAVRHAPDKTTLVLASPSQPPSEQDVRALRAFIEGGGLVLASGQAAASFLPDMPARPNPKAETAAARLGRPRRQERALPTPVTDGVEWIEMASAPTALPLGSPYLVLYGSDSSPAVLAAHFGKGQAFWWASAVPLANGGIGRPNHVELLVNSLGAPAGRTVLWDEFYHGHTRSLWSYVTGTPFLFVALQLAVVVAAALFTHARRRQPIRDRVVVPRTSPLEFIDTMAGLYERAGAASAAVATIAAHLRRRLTTVLGLPPRTDDDRLADAAAHRLSFSSTLGSTSSTLSSTLARARVAAGDPTVSVREATTIAADLQAFLERLDGLNSRRASGSARTSATPETSGTATQSAAERNTTGTQ